MRKIMSCIQRMSEKLSHEWFFFCPNTWKTRLSLLYKSVHFETIPVTPLIVGHDLAIRSNKPNMSLPAIELSNGQFMSDSFRIAEWFDEMYRDQPSLFTADNRSTAETCPEQIPMSENYARIISLDLGASKLGSAVWFDLLFPELEQLMAKGKSDEYFR